MNYINKCLGTKYDLRKQQLTTWRKILLRAPAAVGLGGALAGMEVKPADKKADDKKADAKEESIDIEKYNSIVEDYNDS